MVTQKDIANRLSLSRSLVGKVLSGAPDVWASGETRQRIQEAAREMNYRPNAGARALVTGRTMQLAISGTAATDSLSLEHVLEQQGFVDAAARQQYCVTVLPISDCLDEAGGFEGMLAARRWDGICLHSAFAERLWIPALKAQGVPFIVIGNPGDPTLPQVDHDNWELAYTSVAWLCDQGHTRIGFVNFTEPHRIPYVRTLHAGYHAAMEALCGGYDPAFAPPDYLPHGEKADFVRRNALTAMIVRDQSGARDWQIILQRAGMRVPEDVALLVHLPTTEVSSASPGMACHSYDAYGLGARAAQELLNHVQTGEALQTVLLPASSPDWYHTYI